MRSIWLLAALVGFGRTQTLQCATLAAGCDAGSTYEETLQKAIQRFSGNAVYGGRLGVFASSISQTGTLAQISYSCSDGSVPPPLLGSTAQTLLARILTCPNRCGGVSVAGTNCGLGALIATNADAENCFAKAIDLAPESSQPTVKPTAGGFVSRGCRTDSGSGRALTGGSATEDGMTVERCVQLAQGFRFAGVEFSRECFWGDEIASSSSTAAADQCNMPCAGSLLDVCGGNNRISVYENTTWTPPPPPTPPPTTVPSVGSFQNRGCFVDFANGARVLRADSSTQDGENGMTVEKCIALARDDGWRWAGVEFGSQCFVGNTLRGANSAPAGDCNMRCAGNPGEVCGGSNRIQVYEDTEWKDPTVDELADLIRRYHAAMTAARRLLEEAETLFSDTTPPSGTKTKRQVFGAASSLRNRFGPVTIELRAVGARSTAIVGRYERLDIDEPRPNLPINADDYRNYRAGAQESARTFGNVQTNLDRFLAGELTAPQLLVIIKTALATYGPIIALGIVPAAGIGLLFGIVALIWSKLFPATSNPNPPPATTTTRSSTTPTPVVLLMADGTSQQDYLDVINDIVTRKSIIITRINIEKVELRALTANMTDEAIDVVLANPKVATLSRRIQADPEGRPNDPGLTRRQPSPKAQAKDSPSSLRKRALTLQGRFARFIQSGSLFDDATSSQAEVNGPPFHLSWLTSLWTMTGLRQSNNVRHYAFNNYIYDPVKPAIPVRVYVLDSGTNATHNEFGGAIGISYNAMVEDLRARGDQDKDGHGTCMASCVGGRYSGVFKHAELVPIKILETGREPPWLDHLIRAFALVEFDMKTAGLGPGVMSMSFGFPLDLLKVRDSQEPNRYDPFTHLLPRLPSLNLVPVASTGNNADKGEDLGRSTPRRNGGRNSNLIVIGAVDENSVRWQFSNYLDMQSRGILTGYANGVDVVCAGIQQHDYYRREDGSSPATAQVAGLVALMLGRGEWTVFDAKDSLISEARRLKGANFPPVTSLPPANPAQTTSITIVGNGGLRVALDQLVTCVLPANQGGQSVAVQPMYTRPNKDVFADVISSTALSNLPVAAEPTCVFPPPTMTPQPPILG